MDTTGYPVPGAANFAVVIDMFDPRSLSRPALVLIADDHEWSTRSLETVLSPRGIGVVIARDARTALELARTARPDAVIIDEELPDMDGVELCERLQRDPRFPRNVAIILTGSDADSREQRIEAYNRGAWEFCRQPLDPASLLPKLETFIRAKLACDRVEAESLVDQATGLYNLRGMTRRAREINADAQRRNASVACIAFTSATAANVSGETNADGGERLPAHVAQICRASARQSDVIGRLGPTAFAILAPFTGGRGAARLVERLRESFAAAPFPAEGGERVVSLHTTCLAISNVAESPIDAVELLLQAADSLRGGRGQARAQSRTSGENVAPPIPG
ncbi:MAG TPA: response regulator [Gemmatimonadaceae bacterium]|nr:response regulator [Gemmatimonadaceae bacterium]